MSLTDLINPPKNSQRNLHRWQAKGCSFRPMGNYLKALGLLRIMPQLQGFWQGDCFFIQSEETPDEIINSILTDYEPSAICSPWNGSSGFYPTNRKAKECDLVAEIIESKSTRWHRLKNAYEISQKLTSREGLRAELKSKPDRKYDFISQVRSAAIEPTWAAWLDVVSVAKITVNKQGKARAEYAYPGLTGGTGGTIGRKDMGACFVESLDCLWNLKTGEAKENAKSSIESSLLGISTKKSLLKKALLTQFYPVNDFLLDLSGAATHEEYARAGSTTVLCNPFDAVLIYEGLLTFSGVSCRTKNTKSEKTQASFSLAVDLAIGTADLASFTEDNKRLEEIWLPLNHTPKTWNDIREDLFSSNRHRLPNQQITDTIDLAEELSKWSQDNEINRYVRYAFLPRKGKSSNFAIPIGDFFPGTQNAEDLAAQLRYFRLDCRQISRSDIATPSLISAIALLEKELIELNSGNGSYLNCLIQIGTLEREISYSSILNSDGKFIHALQPLKSKWLDRALIEDNSTECRLGIALANLGLRERATKIRTNTKGNLAWDRDANLDWGRRNLIDNLIFLQRRWSIGCDRESNSMPTKLFTPSFADLDCFIRGNVSDKRIEQIALGASTCIQINREFRGGHLETLTPHYGIGAMCQWGKTSDGKKIGGQGLVLNALVREQPELAMKYGYSRLRSQGLFPYLKHPEFTPNAKRIAAAMAFPLSKNQLSHLQDYYLRSN